MASNPAPVDHAGVATIVRRWGLTAKRSQMVAGSKRSDTPGNRSTTDNRPESGHRKRQGDILGP